MIRRQWVHGRSISAIGSSSSGTIHAETRVLPRCHFQARCLNFLRELLGHPIFNMRVHDLYGIFKALIVEGQPHLKLVDKVDLFDMPIERPIEVLNGQKVELSLLTDAADSAVMFETCTLRASQGCHVLEAKDTTWSDDGDLDINFVRLHLLDVLCVVLPHDLLISGGLRVFQA